MTKIIVVFSDNPGNLEMNRDKEESGIGFWPRRFSDHNNNINTVDVVSSYKNNEQKKIKQNLDLNLDPQNCFQVRKNILRSLLTIGDGNSCVLIS